MSELDNDPQITHFGMLDVQACVPENWTDEQVLSFVEKKYPCGTTVGWVIRRAGDEKLVGASERIKCAGRDGFVHIMLDA